VGDGTVIVSVSGTGLAAGSYSKNLTVTAIGAANGLQTVGVTNSFSGSAQAVRPEIISLNFFNDLAVITWASSVGDSYRVQFVDNLTNTNWTNLSPDVTADGPTAIATDTNDISPQRFYRILLLAP
jgi:basic membrane lipoprotein Med (substrate-binding protein (PBP1-ABC) superfamily)